MKMKLIMSAALLSATAAIAFTACTDKLDESATTPETTVDSKIVEAAAYAPSNDDATAKSSTRTEFAPVNPDAHEGYTVSWSSGDEVLTFELVSTDAGSKSIANLTDGYTSTVNILSGNKGSLSINRTNPEAASWDYISFYPSAAILQSSVISSPYNNQYGTTAGITVPHNRPTVPTLRHRLWRRGHKILRAGMTIRKSSSTSSIS